MLLFSYTKKIEIQSVGKVHVVVVVEQSDKGLVFRMDYHEDFCKWGETQMIVGVYDLDHLEKFRVQHNGKPNSQAMTVDEVHHPMTHLVEISVVVGFPFRQWCQRVTMMEGLMV